MCTENLVSMAPSHTCNVSKFASLVSGVRRVMTICCNPGEKGAAFCSLWVRMESFVKSVGYAFCIVGLGCGRLQGKVARVSFSSWFSGTAGTPRGCGRLLLRHWSQS